MNKNYERQQLIDLITQTIKLNINNCLFMKKLYKNSKEIVKTLNLSIRQSKKGLELLPHIKHIEILRSIYGDCVGKLSGHLMLGGTMLSSKALQKFDNTEKGFKEFLQIEEENRKLNESKLKQRNEMINAVKKAKEEGKKVEYMYDPITKTTKPIIMEKSGDNNA